VGGFYAHWDNLVELAQLSEAEAVSAIRDGQTLVPLTPGIKLVQYRNTTAVKNYGMNTGVEGSFAAGRVGYGFNVAAAVADKSGDEGKTRLPVAPRIFGNARIAVTPATGAPTLALGSYLLGPRPADLSSHFTPGPFARPQLELRLTITGDMPVVKGLSYRAFANYAVAERGPYVVGPVSSETASQPSPQLIPVDRFRTAVGLRYDF
jgi:hypothetical protein